MKIIFYRYGNICEEDVLEVFQKINVEVLEDSFEIEHKFVAVEDKVRHFAEALIEYRKQEEINFVFSMNFFPYVSNLCEKMSILYLCWSADCPVLELYSQSLKNSCNRIFLFDRVQYEDLYQYSPENVFYLPLGTNVERWDRELGELSDKDRAAYATDVSFVGSLYNEKSPLSGKNLSGISEYMRGYIRGVAEAQLLIYGENFLEEMVTPELVGELQACFPDYYRLHDALADSDRFVVANYYLGMLISHMERERLLNRLAKQFEVTVYTRSDTSSLSRNILCKGGVTTHKQMPRVFRLSKVNLNITMKGIQSGLSLRVYDVLGCGGFLLTNYQQEIPAFFEIGRDLECYESMEDCAQKVQYYLSHEEERKEIARNGYAKVKRLYTYENRIMRMMKLLTAASEG